MIKIIVKHEHFYVIRNETFQLFEMANKVIYKFRLWAWAWCACPPYGPQHTVLYKMLVEIRITGRVWLIRSQSQ